MVLTRLIIIIIGIYLAYKFVFDFALPIYRASRRVHQQFKGMHEQMNQNTDNRRNGYSTTNANAGTAKGEPSKASPKDYIDFEEIK